MNFLLKIRKEKNLTQKEIAEALNIKQQQYFRYEKGERELPLKQAIKLADFYKVSLDYLVGRE